MGQDGRTDRAPETDPGREPDIDSDHGAEAHVTRPAEASHQASAHTTPEHDHQPDTHTTPEHDHRPRRARRTEANHEAGARQDRAPQASRGADRDRDTAGRPRQDRPRDALGRPLPYGARGVQPVAEEPLPPADTLILARELLDKGRPFSAHEVLEARWKACPDQERPLWQGLAQLCVALTHAARGNRTGAQRLLERGMDRLEHYRTSGGPTYGLDLGSVEACARSEMQDRR